MSKPSTGKTGALELAEALSQTYPPVLVVAFLALNLAIFLLEVFTGGSTNTLNLIRFGAQYGPAIDAREYWRFITAAFLHIGILHILVNGFCLWELGRPLERLYGSAQFGFTYLISGAGGSLVSFFAHEFVSPQTVSAGASGAIFGVAGALAVAGWRFKHLVPENFGKIFGVGVAPFIALNLYYGFTHPGIDNFAHLGGVTAGVLCGLVLKPQAQTRREAWIAVSGFVILVLIAFGIQYRAARNYDRTLHTAAEMLDAHRLPEAEQALSKIIKQGTLDPRTHVLAGLLKFRKGQREQGIREIREALRVAPGFAPAHRALAATYLAQGNPAAAASEFRSALRLDPRNTTTRLSLAEILILLRKYDEASGEFHAALQLDPRLAAAHYGLGIIATLQEKPEIAEQEFRAALKINPRSTPSRHSLVTTLMKQGRYDEAIKELKLALRINPKDKWAQQTLAAAEEQSKAP